MIPNERSLVEKLKDKPFVIIGVNSDETKQILTDAQKSENITWRSFFDGGGTRGPIASKFNIHGWPTVFLLDKDLKIRWKGHGEPSEELLDLVIAEAEGKPAPDSSEHHDPTTKPPTGGGDR